MFKRYYEDELEYLRSLGAEFAQSWPEIAAELGMRARDPDVERLLQGVAFLTAQVRQEQEARFPALLHPLLETLWPQALRPTPALGIVQFKPRSGIQQEPVLVAAHSSLLSVPVDETPCHFRTTWPLPVLPFSLENLQWESPSPGRVRLHLRLRSLPGVRQTGLDRHPLRFYLGGSPRQNYGTMLLLTRDLRAIHVRGIDAKSQVLFTHTLPPSHLRQLGWSPGEALLPQPENSFRGLRHLHEHFLFPNRSMHFELAPLPALPGISTLSALEMVLDGTVQDTDSPPLTRDQLHLFTVPVVNLFSVSARPITLTSERTEYRLQPDQERPHHVLLYRVQSAAALSPSAGEAVPVQPFMSHRARSVADASSPGAVREAQGQSTAGGRASTPSDGGIPASNARADALLFQLQLRQDGSRGGSDASSSPPRDGGPPDSGRSALSSVSPWVSFVSTSGNPPPPGMVVSFDLEATNGPLPSRLRPGDLKTASTELPAGVTFLNLGGFTAAWPAPIGMDELWRYVSHATLRHQLLSSRKALLSFLTLHHLPALFDQRARLQLDSLLGAIQDVESKVEQALAGDPPGLIRGTHVVLKMHEHRFVHPGELYLFGLSLSHLLGEMTPLNTFTRLSIQGMDGGLELSYPRRSGRQALF